MPPLPRKSGYSDGSRDGAERGELETFRNADSPRRATAKSGKAQGVTAADKRLREPRPKSAIERQVVFQPLRRLAL